MQKELFNPSMGEHLVLEDFKFNLPAERIARFPAEPRDSSRLFILDRKRRVWEHRFFKDLPDYLSSDDLLVANNSKVFKARLYGRRLLDFKRGLSSMTSSGGKLEFFLLERLEPRIWEGLFRANYRVGAGLNFEIIPHTQGLGLESLRARVLRGSEGSEAGTVLVEFEREPLLEGLGEVPLPPYLGRQAEEKDNASYQTIFAKELGSVAAPTAGLHFTPQVLEMLKRKKIGLEEITLHVGLGTFRPIKVKHLSEHLMHEERYFISDQCARHVRMHKEKGKRVIAVGTTSLRALESAWRDGQLQSGYQRTKLFIRPGQHKFQVVEGLLTNFHLPASSLLVLVCAFAGRDLVLSAYKEAIRQGYRFYSYGDAMLIV